MDPDFKIQAQAQIKVTSSKTGSIISSILIITGFAVGLNGWAVFSYRKRT